MRRKGQQGKCSKRKHCKGKEYSELFKGLHEFRYGHRHIIADNRKRIDREPVNTDMMFFREDKELLENITRVLGRINIGN